MSFGSVIINWYKRNKRDLPWRETKDPYLIWLSEIILQQTRVEQGLPYYYRFADKYPTVGKLARAKEDDVLKLWQGLGYYSRARNMHTAAKQIQVEFGGKFPTAYENIRLLKGVGDYTAAAISSFAFDQPRPVVDGNVFRLLSRYFGIKTPIDTGEGKKMFTVLAGKLIHTFPPALFNQAIMEFGARQCKSANPGCENCPLSISCFAFHRKKVNLFPVKKNKTKIRNRYFNYLVVRHQQSVFIKKRTEKDIWQGLHDFPLIETVKKINVPTLVSSTEWKSIFNKKKITLKEVSKEYKHLLSHQTIHARFFLIEITDGKTALNEKNWLKINNKLFNRYAIPRLIERYLQDI